VAREKRNLKKKDRSNVWLRGWPAIAAYLGQAVSTAQRWGKSGMPVERVGRVMTANPESLNRWLAAQPHSKQPFHIVHTGEHDLVSDLTHGLAAARKNGHSKK
jgi:hypothetical protein